MTRQRFTVAREIGHFSFHRERLATMVVDSGAYRADVVAAPSPDIGREKECQANTFAANLLIAPQFPRAAQASGMTGDEEPSAHFQVSRAAMRIPLGLPAAA